MNTIAIKDNMQMSLKKYQNLMKMSLEEIILMLVEWISIIIPLINTQTQPLEKKPNIRQRVNIIQKLTQRFKTDRVYTMLVKTVHTWLWETNILRSGSSQLEKWTLVILSLEQSKIYSKLFLMVSGRLSTTLKHLL